MPHVYEIHNKDCYGLASISANTIDALITDPPYGISYQNNYWDKDLPDRRIWEDCLRVMKPGAYGLIFSSVRLMHRMMVSLEDSGFMIKDVLFWVFLNGMPKSRDVALNIDKELGKESEIVGAYNYVQGYVKGGADDYRVKEKKHKKKGSGSRCPKVPRCWYGHKACLRADYFGAEKNRREKRGEKYSEIRYRCVEFRGNKNSLCGE